MPDFSSYLESVRRHYEQWWSLYTLTDAEGWAKAKTQGTLFDFGLMVHPIASKGDRMEDERSQTETIERFGVLDGLRKYAGEHVLLVGRPGSGKSTALARLLLEESEKGDRIPVLVELRYWNEQGVLGLIQGFLRSLPTQVELTPVEVDRTTLEELLRSNRFLLLMDGLNELPSEAARQDVLRFRREFPKVAIVFTTRDLSVGGDFGIEKKLEMQALTETQMRDFVTAYLAEQSEAMLRQLGTRLREFGSTPLLLWMLCEVFKQSPNSQLPSNLAGIFQIFTGMYESSSIRKHEVAVLKGDVSPLSDRRLWKPALKHLAATMMQGEKSTDFRVVLTRTEAEDALSKAFPNEKFPIRDILDDLLKYHLLQNKPPEQVEFRHQLIQEYYAAEWLLVRVKGLDDATLQQEFLNYLKWTEPVALMLALVEDEAIAVRVVELALDVDLMLGARLAGEVRSGFQLATVNCIIQRNFQTSLTIQLLEHSRSLESVSFFYEILDNGCPDTRWRATRALSALPIPYVIDKLLQLLDDDDDSVRHKSLEALGLFHAEEVISKIYQRTNDKYFLVRSVAIEILGKLSKSSLLACDYLQKALTNKDYTVRMYAAEYLGEIIPDKLADLLQYRFQTEDEDTQRDILQLLGRSRNIISLPIILAALSHQNWTLRSAAISEITSLAIWLDSDAMKSAIPFLIQSIENDSEPSVRSTAAMSLKFIQSPVLMNKLLDTLKQESHPIVKSSIIESLSYFSEKYIIAKLISNYLSDSEFHVRVSAVKALRILDVKEFLPTVRKLVKDINLEVRNEAILCLGYSTDSENINLLYKFLKSKEFQTRLSSAYSLSRLKNRKGIPILKEAIKYGNKEAREMAISALMNFVDQAGNNMILDRALLDQEYAIRRKAADFLSAFRDKDDFHGKIVATISGNNEDHQRNAVDLAKVLGTSKILPYLKQITEEILVVERPIEAIVKIQANCKFYNYEIQQAKLRKADRTSLEGGGGDRPSLAKIEDKLETIDRRTQQMADQPKNDFSGATFSAPVNFGDNPTGDFVGTQNNYTTDPEIKSAIADLKTLITDLQIQHPNVTTETQAIEIIDAEFNKIQQIPNNKFRNLGKQLRNPERHFQAGKAAIVEVAKKQLDQSLIATAIVTYLDKLSETPDKGV